MQHSSSAGRGGHPLLKDVLARHAPIGGAAFLDAEITRGRICRLSPVSRCRSIQRISLAPRTEAEQSNGLPDEAQGLTRSSIDASATAARDVQSANDARLLVWRVLSHYRLEEPLGAGGMGVVYRATDLKLGRAVAIKLLSRQLAGDEGAKARLLREARSASALDHPNIGVIYEIGDHDGELFIAMALYEGETLKQRLEKGPLPLEEALAICRQILLGLQAAHAAGIVHRDIKPANILLTGNGTVKILDFGLAKLVSDSQAQTMTRAGEAMGTVLYMSPEQLRGGPVEARSDLWSLGVVAQEMLAGVSPFQADSSAATAIRILNDEPASLAAVPGVPDWLAQLVSQLLQKSSAERPRTAAEVYRRLEDAAETRTTSKKRVSSGLRGSRLWVVLVTIGVIATTAGVAWYFLRDGAPGRAQSAAAVAPSIAVLPFADRSEKKDQEYFSDGIAEEILDALARIEGLRVVGRTSSFSFKGKSDDLRSIGQKLNVSTVLEGSVRKEGNRVRIAAQLVNARDGFQLWSQTYDRELTGVFAAQDEISEAVVAALKVRLMPGAEARARRRTSNPEAHNEYLLGNQFLYRLTMENYRRAAVAYQRAVGLDPGFAAGWAGLASATFWVADGAETAAEVSEGYGRAMAAAEKAIALDPELADGYAARGFLRGGVRWDWKGARADFERALELNPGDADTHRRYAYIVLASLGHLHEAIREAEKATNIDPLSAVAWWTLGRLYYSDGQLEAADAVLEKSLQIAPDQNFAAAHLAAVRLLQRRPADSLAIAERSTSEMFRLLCRALAMHDLGRPADAERARDELIARFSHTGAYQIAVVQAWFGNHDSAFDWLERAYTQRDGGLHSLKFDVLLRNLRGDARYKALLKKMNLPVE
jgi:serine/threonine protein kinase/tetratricopeptide (TPR) repeat protein